jgi:flavin reductase ActVB
MSSDERQTAPDDQRLTGSFISAMSRLAAGVVMVTNWMGDQAWGLTISACCSVSASPPVVLISLGENTTTARLTLEHGYFGVNILGEQSLVAAEAASVRGAPKFVAQYCRTEDVVSRAPVVQESLAHLECDVERVVEVADHIIVVGRVQGVLLLGDDAPLLYYGRGYRTLAGHPEDRFSGW